MIVRDPASNARWTVEAVLRRRGLALARPLAEVATPAAAKREALERAVPVLLSRRVLKSRSRRCRPSTASPPALVRARAARGRDAVGGRRGPYGAPFARRRSSERLPSRPWRA